MVTNEALVYGATSTLDKHLLKWGSVFTVSIVSAVEGLLTAVNDTIIFFIPTIVIVLVDMFTAVRLNKRVAKKYPNLVKDNDGKLRSHPGLKAVSKIIKMFTGIIIGSFVDQLGLFPSESGVHTVFIGFLIVQLWSILENTSSENNSAWAKVAQKVVINKASRHLNIDKSELEELLKSEIHTYEKYTDLDLDNGVPSSIGDGGDNNITEEENSISDNRGKQNNRQSGIDATTIRWRSGEKYDIEAYREIIQELERQLDESRKKLSERAENKG